MNMTAAMYIGINSGLDPAMIRCEQYQKLLQLRKESSIPGSVIPQDAAGGLFENDLQQAKPVQSVNFTCGSGKRFKGFQGKRTFPSSQWGGNNHTSKRRAVSHMGRRIILRRFVLLTCAKAVLIVPQVEDGAAMAAKVPKATAASLAVKAEGYLCCRRPTYDPNQFYVEAVMANPG